RLAPLGCRVASALPFVYTNLTARLQQATGVFAHFSGIPAGTPGCDTWSLRNTFSSRRSTAPGGRPAGVALAAGTAADQRQLAALAARVALVALETGQADLLFHRLAGAALGPGVLVAVAAMLRQRVQVLAARRGEDLGQRLRLDDPLGDHLFRLELG